MQKRGAAVIGKRKLSSAMSAAKAAVDHMRDWFKGTPEVCILHCSLKETKSATMNIFRNFLFSF